MAATPLGRIGLVLLVVIPTAFLAIFFVYPVVSILLMGLAPDGRVSLRPFLDVIGRSDLRGAAWFTLWQAAVSTLATLAVGLPAAYVFARFRFPGRSIIRALTLVPFVLPTLVVGTAFLALLGPRAPLGIDLSGSVWLILIAHVFYNYAIVVRGVGSAWEQIDPRLEDAARVLGAGRWAAFRSVTLPLLRPAIASAGALVFLFSFTSFGVILILGDLRHTTLEVEIWRQTTAFLNLDLAAALAVIQLVGVGIVLVTYGRYQERRAVQIRMRPAGETARTPRTRGEKSLVTATLAFMGIFLGLPLLVLIVRSLQVPTGWGTANFTNLATEAGGALSVPPLGAIGNTVAIGAAAMVIAVSIGLLAAVVVAYVGGRSGRSFDTFLMLPLGTSAVTIGFGFLIALDEPIDLRASLLLMPIAHALVAIPFVVRATVPVMRAVQHRLREAAMTLGASPSRAWREVDLPLIARALLVGAAFAFAVSVGEFGATSLIVRPTTPTVPLAIFRLLSQPGSTTFGMAMALSVVLMLITAAAVSGIEAIRRGSSEEI
jgi:thiamine transport system permease protein